ncbi:MAG TPA: heme-binding protein [Pyrinomonadaceae bacterium]|nr:heme-binding protein [Pyrinomonadaceae bacterium]
MNRKSESACKRLLIICCLLTLVVAGGANRIRRASAQSSRPVLISEATSTRALAFESVTQKREPLPLTSSLPFGADNRTRVMLFATNLSLQPGDGASSVTAEAEDGAHRIYPLVVEYVGPVPDQPWASSIIVRLSDELGDVGDVLVKIIYRGQSSNRVRFGVGHTGGGPADDLGAIPTPGSITPPPPPNQATAGDLSTGEVQQLLAQAVSVAAQLNRPVTVAVVDREANVLGVFKMTNAPANTLIRGGGAAGQGLEGMSVPATLAAISKAGTAALLSSGGNAFTSRTASFIIQEHIPPGVDNRPGGPLYGVQYSSLPCSDIKKPGVPLGPSADAGSVPLYRNGVLLGGIGIEGDGLYSLDKDPADFDQPFEEVIAVSAARGFESPALIRADNILADGVRLPFVNVENAPAPPTLAFGSLPGTIDPLFPVRPAQTSAFTPAVVGGIAGEVDARFFPFIGSPASALSAADVNTIISHAAQQANVTRGAIRQPLGSSARVSISVVDTDGRVLGLFRTADAPVFGFDVAVQKARAAMFFSKANAASSLRAAGFGTYADRAAADGLALNGGVAHTTRSVGFLHRPLFPDGINNTPPGPFSTGLPQWSVFNVGLQLDLVKANLLATLGGMSVPCTAIPELANGAQIFAGSVPLYKNGVLVGAIGISGDGIDQDDIIAAAGAQGYAPPVEIRADQSLVRGVRLPFVKFPRSPNL